MDQKIVVYLRGAIGDICVWMPKFKGLFQKYDDKKISWLLNSRYSPEETMILLCENKEMKEFYKNNPKSIKILPYEGAWLKIKFEGVLLYLFDIWDIEKNIFREPVSQLYSELGFETYPVVLEKKDIDKYVIIHPSGFLADRQNLWSRKYWQELINKIRDKGYQVVITGGPYDFANIINNRPLPDFRTLIDITKHAKLWIGIDTGIRNLAMIYQVPVIELGTPGQGTFSYDVFHPAEYRNRSKFFENIDNLIPEDIIKASEKWL